MRGGLSTHPTSQPQNTDGDEYETRRGRDYRDLAALASPICKRNTDRIDAHQKCDSTEKTIQDGDGAQKDSHER
jgi:hypothetical protein